VRETPKGLRFLGEALGVLTVWGANDFDSDVGTVHFVDGAKDVRHSAATEQRTETVPSIQQLAGRTHLVNAEPSVDIASPSTPLAGHSSSRDLNASAGALFAKATSKHTGVMTSIYRTTCN
jgi:hypothetical protein